MCLFAASRSDRSRNRTAVERVYTASDRGWRGVRGNRGISKRGGQEEERREFTYASFLNGHISDFQVLKWDDATRFLIL